MDPKQRQFSIWYMFIALWVLMLIQMFLPSVFNPTEIPYSEFKEAVEAGKVTEVAVSPQIIHGKMKEDKVFNTIRIEDPDLLRSLAQHQVKVTGVIESTLFRDVLSWIVPIALFFGVWWFLLRRMGQSQGFMTVGQSKAKIYMEKEVKVSFADVAGVDEAKQELEEVIEFLKTPEKFRRLGGKIPKGILLVGPPGTGKTLLAKAVAGEASVPFFSISGSEFVEMFVGVGAARVRDLFEQAKQKAPCIVFIDELDAIGKSRTTGRGIGFSNEEREQTLNQLLAEMDGFDTSEGVILMAATNQPEVLDAALMRAGRFDRQVLVDRPDLKGREEILQVHARKIHMAPDVDLKIIAARTPGMAGADLANIVNESALLAVRRGSTSVELRDLEEAIDRVMLGLEKKRRVMTPAEKERIAYHESGHTLVALSVEHADPVHRVSIIPRSIGALGYTLQLPTQERFLMTQPELEDRLTVLLGGRAAEEIQYKGIVSTGAADDLDRASELARQMVTRFGMSGQLGKLTYGHPLASPFLKSMFTAEEKNYSDATARIIDEESKRIVDAAFLRAESILREREEQLDHLASELIRKETLSKEELTAVVQATAARQAGSR